ncbi:hypothetical protein GPL17_22680 [Bradyrhizobium yuanmingense]|nr:hypothetical protein [Bradyrhizobium yuanmingense]
MRADRFKCREIGADAISRTNASSLRAQRSSPACLRGIILDCFVARAPRNDDVAADGRYTLSVDVCPTPAPACARDRRRRTRADNARFPRAGRSPSPDCRRA